MKHHTHINHGPHDYTNLRAEDGWQMRDRRRAIYDAILAPVILFVIIATILLLVGHPAFGQAGGGRIAGSVKDFTGAVIPGTSVTLTNAATGITQSAKSNDNGIFYFPTVSIGEYRLDVTATGFNSYRQTAGLKIDVNTALSIDVVLQIAQANESVIVTENTAELRTTDTQIGQTIESKQVVDVPLNGRSNTDPACLSLCQLLGAFLGVAHATP